MPPPYLRQCGMCKYSASYQPPGRYKHKHRHKQDGAVCRRAAGENMRDRKAEAQDAVRADKMQAEAVGEGLQMSSVVGRQRGARFGRCPTMLLVPPIRD